MTGAHRSPSIPELPTMSEAALPGYEATAWYGLLGPAGMPPAAIRALSTAALAALQTQEVKDRLFASGVEVRPMPPDEFARLIDSGDSNRLSAPIDGARVELRCAKKSRVAPAFYKLAFGVSRSGRAGCR